MRVYLDGVFDLFHVGHLACIRAAHKVACENGCVSSIITHCPLIVTPEFLNLHRIDLVVHGFANDADRERQRPFFASIGAKFREIDYFRGVSTTELIQRVKEVE